MLRRRGVEIFIALGLPVLFLAPGLQASDGPELDDLQWLAGHWTGTDGGVEMEELWTVPKGGMMLGIHRDVASSRPAFFEYLRIEEREHAVVYIASPRGQGATEFVLTLINEQTAVFENPDHDFPRKITYRRMGIRLLVRVEGEIDGAPQSQAWEWRLLD